MRDEQQIPLFANLGWRGALHTSFDLTRLAVFLTTICFLSSATVSKAQNQPGSSSVSASSLPRNIDSNLARLYNLTKAQQAAEQARAPAAVRDKTAKALENLKQQVAVGADDRPLLSIRSVGPTDPVVTQLKALGAKVHLTSEKHGIIEAWVTIDDLPAVAQIKGVLSVSPVYRPILRAGSVQTQGDAVMHADTVRSNGLSGAPFLVGALSDSALSISDSQATGDLPDVVDRYLEFPATDEGRAMLEIVHDIAPGARLAHHSAILSDLSFADGIHKLAAAGCKVIVDDVGYFRQPFFQDGVLAQAVNEVAESNGVIYVSAAGNESDLSYEAVFDEDLATHFHDFDPGLAVDIFQQITLPNVPPGPYQSTMTLVLQWDDPFSTTNGVTHDYDVFIYDAAGSNQLASSTSDNIASQEPIEVLQWTRVNGDPTVANVAIKRIAGNGLSRLKYVLFKAESINTWHTHSGTIFGQAASADAIAVGAVPFYDPTNIESFSSHGDVTIYFDPDGNRLTTPELRHKPDVVAPDAVNTSFFGPVITNGTEVLHEFIGTSAAAPHVAGVAALILNANPHLTVAQLHHVLTSTAVDLGAPGPDPVFGYGLVDAEAARIAAASVPDTTPPTVRLLSPIPVHGWPVKQIKLQFSEPLNLVTVTNTANYSLVQAGNDGMFDTGDDVTYAVAAGYDTNAYTVFLTFTAPTSILSNGQYRLTLNGTTGLSDPAGNPLSGGTNAVFEFLVTNRSSIVDIEGGSQLTVRSNGTLFVAYPYNFDYWYHQTMIGRFDQGGGSAGPSWAIPSVMPSFEMDGPDVAVNDSAGVVVYADDKVQVPGYPSVWSLSSQFLDQDGKPVGVRLGQRVLTWGCPTRVAMNMTGSIAVAFIQVVGGDGSWTQIYGELLAPDGSLICPLFPVSQPQGAVNPVVGIASNGMSVYAWNVSNAYGGGIRARRFGPDGVALGDEFLVSLVTAGGEESPAIAVAQDGSFVVVWQRPTGVFMRRFDTNAVALCDEVLVYRAGSDSHIALSPDGRFIVVWLAPDGDGNGVFAQRFAANGTPLGARLWVSEGAVGDQTEPRVGISGDGNFVVLWGSGDKAQARWIAGNAPDEFVPFDGPWVRTQSPTLPLAPPVDHFSVTFDWQMNAATFGTNDVQLFDPVGRPVAATSISTTDGQTFTVHFNQQTVAGIYRFSVGPDIEDTLGRQMNQDGDGTNGEPSDAFVSQFSLASTPVGIPYVQNFEGGSVEALTGWSFATTGAGMITIAPESPLVTGTNCLKLGALTPGTETAILTLNLAGATNVTLDFWGARSYYDYESTVAISQDGTNWYQVWRLNGGWEHVIVDLDAAVRGAGIAYGADFHIRFYHASGSYIDRDYGANLWLDDVRIVTGLDSDGDGMPDAWEIAHGLNPDDPTDATQDADGDGMSNLSEYLAGTDPKDASSVLRITAIEKVGADIRVSFTSVSGRSYCLDRCDVIGGAWTNLLDAIPGNDGIQQATDIGGASGPSAFYRVRLNQSANPALADSDGDGMPDWWTQLYFGHPTGQIADHSCASDDPDGDGFTNLQEYLTGTNPTNSASAFRIISVAQEGDDIRVTWSAGGGRTNVLQATTGNANGSYTNAFIDLGNLIIIPGSGDVTTNSVDTGGATNVPARFYRVRLVP